jgi:hypothetical protein
LALANTHTHTGFFGLHSRPVVWLSIQAFYMIMSNNFIPPTTPQMPSLKQKVKTGKEKKKMKMMISFFLFCLAGQPLSFLLTNWI